MEPVAASFSAPLVQQEYTAPAEQNDGESGGDHQAAGRAFTRSGVRVLGRAFAFTCPSARARVCPRALGRAFAFTRSSLRVLGRAFVFTCPRARTFTRSSLRVLGRAFAFTYPSARARVHAFPRVLGRAFAFTYPSASACVPAFTRGFAAFIRPGRAASRRR
ncbi:MAG: hypothetical protein LBH21_04845, partial [Gracilibacteraceae bacterium]|nr:hypothetical protein [Gracilibacteraceae bacterium]